MKRTFTQRSPTLQADGLIVADPRYFSGSLQAHPYNTWQVSHA